jgi:hypothetical protein
LSGAFRRLFFPVRKCGLIRSATGIIVFLYYISFSSEKINGKMKDICYEKTFYSACSLSASGTFAFDACFMSFRCLLQGAGCKQSQGIPA